MIKSVKTFFLLIFIPVIITAQQYSNIHFEHLSVEDGLSHGTVNCIYHDSKGFMWFGTEDGLNKFDGYKFIVFRHDPDDSTSLSNNDIRDIYEDQSSHLWIATGGGGLNRFNHDAEKFKHYNFSPNNPKSISSNDIEQITGHNYGGREVLWLGTTIGLNKFDIETEEFNRYHVTDRGHPYNYIGSLVVDKSGKVWAGCLDGGIHKFDPETEKYTHYQNDPNDPYSLSSNLINSFLLDHTGTLWIGTGGGLNRFDSKSDQFTHFQNNPYKSTILNDDRVFSMYENNNGDIWLGTWQNGLKKFNRKTQKITKYKHDSNKPSSLSSNSIMSIYQDKSDVIWIGTRQGGLNKFNPQKKQFTHPQLESLLNNLNLPIWGICESNSGILWLGTWGKGLVKIDRKRGRISHYLHDPNKPNSLSNNIVGVIIESQFNGKNVLWVGTSDGLNKFDPETGKFTRYLHNPADSNSISDNRIRSIYEDKHGVLWVGTQLGGLNKFNRKTNQFSRIGPRMGILYLFKDRSGEFWFGGWRGLKKLNRETEKYISYWHNPQNPNSISNNNILSLNETNFNGKDILWIGTAGGLNKFDRESEKFISYTTKNGLSNDVINGILEDDSGNLWLSTNNGLSRFNPEKETFRNYDVQDGLKSIQYVPGVFEKGRKGEMFFGGIKGLDAFYPDKIKDNPQIPPVIITDFQIFNKPVKIREDNNVEKNQEYFLPKSINSIDEIELSYRESVFSFEFAALDFRGPKKNKYAYKMEGVDPDWVYTDASRRFATYTNLDPGEYTFRVKGSNNDGVWNEEGTSLKVTITPPWWKTNLAYTFYVFLFGFIVFGVWRFQTNRLKMKHELELEHMHAEKLEEADQFKSRFFANVSHEFRTPLTLILGPVEQMFSGEYKGNYKEQYKVIIRNARRLLQLINQLLDLSKLESGKLKLHAEATEIVRLTNGLVQAFESSAERKSIDLKFQPEIESQEVYIDVEKFETIINNLLSNAFKFTPEGGEIGMTVKIPNIKHQIPNPKFLVPDSDFVEIIISNTGPGIPADRIDKIFDRFYQVNDSFKKDQEGTGIGLALTKELVELHHGEIRVESKQDTKTTFTVLLPLGKDHLKEDEIATITQDYSPSEIGASGLSEFAEEITKAEGRKKTFESEISKQENQPIILIVEDNADLRQYIRSNMDNQYRILEAENGEKGLEKAIKEIPDLIISDVMMPKMDGFEFCAKIKTNERTCHIPVILITARAAQEDKIEGLETGADDYITKPFDHKELNVRVKNLIEQRRKLRERFIKDAMLEPSEIAVTSIDKQFLNRALEIIEKEISNPEFDVETFVKTMAVSRTHLYNKLRALAGQSAKEFIRTIRLKRGAQLIRKQAGTISEIAYGVGFLNPAYFSECFRKQFGQSPSQFVSQLKDS